MKKYVEVLANNDMINIDDLLILKPVQLEGFNMSIGALNRINIKIDEHRAFVLASGQKVFETEFVHKECWIFYEVDYEKLRTLKGCECLGDLTATSNDALKA